MKKIANICLLTTGLLSLGVNATEVSVSGFGSLVGTTKLSDEGYWVKHPSGAGYYADSGFDLTEESLIGLQGSMAFSPKLSVTAQVISRGQDNWKPSIEQFFASYDATNEWNFKVGKMRNPVYMYSDAMDIHYSFGWLRTPGASYSLSVISFDGISAMYTNSWGEISNRTIAYYGKTEKNPDPFLTELFVNRNFNSRFTTGEKDANGNYIPLASFKSTVNDLFGISTEFYYGNWTAHLAFMEAGGSEGTNIYANGTTFDEKYPWRDFYDVALSYDDGNWFAIAEWNEYVDVYQSYYVTLGKYWNEWQFLATYSKFEGELKLANGFTLPKERNEHTNSITLSSRYDIANGVALKAELIMFENEHSLIVPDTDNDGKIDSSILSLAVDFVF